MEILNSQIETYCLRHTSDEPALLQQLNRETHAKVLQPRMLSGHFQGRFLSMISHMISPKYIIEIGTYTGYSALCLAEGLTTDGKLITIDINEELENFTRKFINESAFSTQIDYRIGDAAEIIPTLPNGIDLVFIDADKVNYQKYYDLIFDKISVGGYILSDNVLWDGKVADEEKVDKKTKILRNFNQNATQDTRTENILLPIRDGLMLSRKLA